MKRPKGIQKLADGDLSRRRLLGGALATLAGAKAVDNALLGFGVLVGTNLRAQNLSTIARERFAPSPFTTAVSGYHLELRNGAVRIRHGNTRKTIPISSTPDEATAVDTELGLSGTPLTQLVRDLSAISDDEFQFEFLQYERFFERLRSANVRPFTVQAMRGNRFIHVPPSTIESFVGASPRDPKAVLEGLVGGFRGHTYYDVPRYLAGSIEDNVIFGMIDLRRYFESPTTFEALQSGETDGMFCYEFTWRAIEALHAVPPHQQRPPVLGAMVFDDRHGHVYVGIASIIRDASGLSVPMTFVDYRNSTLVDDFHVRGLVGNSLGAYDERHRATEIHWQP